MLTRLPNGDWIDPTRIRGIRCRAERKLSDSFFIPSSVQLDLENETTIEAAIGLDYVTMSRLADELASLCNNADNPAPPNVVDAPLTHEPPEENP